MLLVTRAALVGFSDGRPGAEVIYGTMGEHEPIDVAIVGGGCAGITAAFELTRPAHRGRYRVTVYQVGWRLGGKGASGRGPADRIEEHGLHVWMGFYENAFRLLRDAYEELDRDPATCRIARWTQAFVPDPVVGVVDRDRHGERQNWLAHFPPAPGLPGDVEPPSGPMDVGHYLVRTAGLVATLLRSAESGRAGATAAQAGAGSVPPPTAEVVAEGIGRIFRYGVLASLAGLVEAVRLLETMLPVLARYPQSLPLRLLDEIASSARRQLAMVAEEDDDTRRLWQIVDLLLAILRGGIRFGLATDPRGLDSIDEYDWREWLRMNGASDAALESAFLAGNYALMFGYEDGDVARPRMAAGQALRGAFRMFFTYRGSLFWKMTAGMGDVVFAPFYEVLRRRGVRFRFFHRLENVGLADPISLGPGERPYVESLDFDVQAEVAGADEYRPLVDVRGLPCWPAQPDWSQLIDGERLREEHHRFEDWWDRRAVGRRRLEVGRDFDAVVLAVGLGAIPHVAGEIVAADPRWRHMVERVGTVATQAFQLWVRDDLPGLGWREPSVSISAFVQPFETWADMPQLRDEESWPTPPGSIAYFCGVLPDPPVLPDRDAADYPRKRHDDVRATAVDFLERHVGHFWPRAVRPGGGFRWELLLDAEQASTPGGDPGDTDPGRFDSQYWTANVNPSDRYVLSLPGTQHDRISPLELTCDNMTVAGDWTACGHAAGCVEAAVISGRLAAHALAEQPRLEDIIGYDHP